MISQKLSIVPLLGSLVMVAGLCSAEELPLVRADVMYASAQVIRGVHHADDSAQVAAELNGESWQGFFVSNQPFAKDEERAVALGVAYRWPEFVGLKFRTALRQSWFTHALAGALAQSSEASVTAALPSWRGFTPGVEYARDFRRRADFTEVALKKSFALTQLGAFVDCKVYSGWASAADWRPDAAGAPQRDGYRYWGAEAQVPYRIGLHTTLLGAGHYAEEAGRSALNGPAGLGFGGKFWISVGVSLDF